MTSDFCVIVLNFMSKEHKRKTKKTSTGAASPFVYCGPARFAGWSGDAPITVRLQLEKAAPPQFPSGT
jgi:hypothetical protein